MKQGRWVMAWGLGKTGGWLPTVVNGDPPPKGGILGLEEGPGREGDVGRRSVRGDLPRRRDWRR